MLISKYSLWSFFTQQTLRDTPTDGEEIWWTESWPWISIDLTHHTKSSVRQTLKEMLRWCLVLILLVPPGDTSGFPCYGCSKDIWRRNPQKRQPVSGHLLLDFNYQLISCSNNFLYVIVKKKTPANCKKTPKPTQYFFGNVNIITDLRINYECSSSSSDDIEKAMLFKINYMLVYMHAIYGVCIWFFWKFYISI